MQVKSRRTEFSTHFLSIRILLCFLVKSHCKKLKVEQLKGDLYLKIPEFGLPWWRSG